MTVYELRDLVELMLEEPETDCGRSLEQYLRALWYLVQEHQTTDITYDWVATALRRSFSVDPAPFEVSWLDYTDPPDEGQVRDDFEFLRRTVLFQIADLRRMAGRQLNDPYRELGVQSSTGSTWYNFEPHLYLECAMRGFIDNLKVGRWTEYERHCTWRTLAIVLELGRLYE